MKITTVGQFYDLIQASTAWLSRENLKDSKQNIQLLKKGGKTQCYLHK